MVVKSLSVEEIVAKCREIFDDPSFQAVKDWKSRTPGGKAVGCFPVYTPVELIHAAGLLPVGVIGAGNQIEIAHADSRFQSFICSIVKSTLELGLTGRLDAFEGMVFDSICDPARNLASVVKRNLPNLKVEYIHFPQNMDTPLAAQYLEREYERIKKTFEEIASRRVLDEDLHRSIRIYNRTRGLVKSLYGLRRARPQSLSAAESYALVRVGTRIPPEEHLHLLQDALEAARGREAKRKDRITVVVEGSFCEQPPVDLIATLEEAGCYILDDDFLLGWRWFLDEVPSDGSPTRGLAQSYIDRSVFASVKHDTRTTKAAHLIQKVRESGADAVIVLAPKFCEPALFDYALYRKALDDADIPHLFLEYEEKMWMYDSLQTQVETFVESMLFD
ncbi:MAG: 2-hydroxyacyl-CoA dehydratase [Chloroflexi bacterium]|nr:2-hydroxyacyl-CoA dehydratase [Chloroflexota bacterium]